MAWCLNRSDYPIRGSPLFGAIVVVCAILLGIFRGSANAQGDPNVASGSVDLDIALLFRISGIGDISFPSYIGHGNVSQSDDVCVWTNAASGGYKVTAHGSGTSSAFVVSKQGDATKTIPYSVSWTTSAGTISLTANVTSGDLSGANTVSSSCASGPATPATYSISMLESDILQVPAGSYSGIVTLVISAPSS